jgi:creatinine amidohydrolase
MHRFVTATCVVVFSMTIASPQLKPPSKKIPQESDVELEMMTWPELKEAMREKQKITALVFNGGTEQRGPQNVNGGHTLMARATVKAIAQRLGNAIAAPVLPFSVNNASADLPGTIGISPPLFAAVNEQVAEQLIRNGFKNIVLMGDHGGGQQELKEVATKLDEKYSTQGIRIIYCGDVYTRPGWQPTAIRRVFMRGSRTLRRCSIWVATTAGCERIWFRQRSVIHRSNRAPKPIQTPSESITEL